ncbi:histidine phosphatase family protein [Protaetiibacter mangrovi]|uniref:Histidine phosphatase family protein n=1 Tax=Protaetiibacter mangrovi TaxID=2970926 RepID=A0ABT1ZGA9_9MICO|nr:histidine phosphatase family protein [Protaetiibacter mangrovi]MCS0499739.1 histidine phosphatase family protein [Protaetiibacter mangrovi]TPX02675.1 histidine phosphatase family protein [Schumannella luteola]
MPADLVHLVRHGEVFNPDRVLYGRLPGFGLSELGHRMAAMAAVSFADRPVTALVASPLQRTRESAAPWAARFGLEPRIDERLIEPANRFEGTNVRRGLRDPRNWPYLVGPWRPTWGEAFTSIRTRMMAAVAQAYAETDGGDAVLVTHQLPIWMVARTVARKPLAHDPRTRRCALSSITTLAWRDGAFVEVDYQEPAAELLAQSIDLGAV